MKSITTLEQAQQAINELQNRLDTINSKNWDRRKTRIVNAHPSVDDYDYVVRKELLERVGTVEQVISGYGYKEYVFGLGISGNIAVGIDVCPHFISSYSLVPDLCLSKVKTAPTGSDIQVQVYKNGVTALFSTPITIPDSSTSVQVKTNFALTSIGYKDYLTCSVLQVGSLNPGSVMTVYIRFKIIGAPNG